MIVAAAPDIATGDALGSCVFNLAIFSLIDLRHRKPAMDTAASASHIMSAGFGVVLLAAAALALLLTPIVTIPSIGHVSVASLLIVALYVLGMRTLYRTEQRAVAVRNASGPEISLKHALTGYAVASAVVVGAGIWLPLIGVNLAQAMGWSHSFVGTLFVALATSVPELATTWGALRIGAIDMAIGNLLGSNLFDVLILAIDDFAFLPGPLYANVSPLHAVSALSACMMSGAVITALAYRPPRRVWSTVSWASIALLLIYSLNAGLQYRLSR